MAHVKGREGKWEWVCPRCKLPIIYSVQDIQHYRHDVEGTNVYVQCPNCGNETDCYHKAVELGVIPSEW